MDLHLGKFAVPTLITSNRVKFNQHFQDVDDEDIRKWTIIQKRPMIVILKE
jgi:hypothetical protein